MTPCRILLLTAILWAGGAGGAVSEHWVMQPLVKPVPPAVSDSSRVRNEIDLFVQARLEEQGLGLAAEADRATLVRRLSFDLIGLPPTPEEVAAFVADGGEQAYERLVERLLGSPHYGERWARHWLDVARFSESQGFEYDRLRDRGWHYRDYVIEAFNSDKPYDRFVKEQIAGDVIEPLTAAGMVATSLLVCGAYDEAGNSQQNQTQRMVTREEEMDDLVSVVSQSFLGLTVNCARCHDHKYDPIPQEDYYRMKAVFEGVIHGEREITPPAERAAREAKVKEANDRIAVLLAEMEGMRVKAGRGLAPAAEVPTTPAPYACWTFEENADDVVGGMHGRLEGGARVEGGRLHLNGEGQFLRTGPIGKAIQEKTLAAWVALGTLDQRGGGVVTLQGEGGGIFDSIVFGEREKGKWMAGSDSFERSRNLSAPEETAVPGELIHMAIVYGADRRVSVYRNGKQYGEGYQTASIVRFGEGKATVLLGQRHTGGGSPFFNGQIEEASLFDRALSAAEVEALAVGPGGGISVEELLSRMEPPAREGYLEAAREVERLERTLAEMPPGGVSYVGRRRQPEPTRLLIRGSVKQPGDEMAPRGLSAIREPGPDFGLAPDAPEAERRRRFAEWVVDPRNPLAARTMANRVWHYHFGLGLAETPNDLGGGGVRPSHPRLLDWLAVLFRENGWSVKQLHRLIVTSATYRQSSAYDEKAQAIDAGNRLFWRYAPRRLEAEAVRDAMLAVSGQLNPAMGGPGFRPFVMSTYGSVFYELQDRAEPEFNRRTIYRIHVNSGKDPLLDSFDCPDPSVKTPQRISTVTPLQALGLMNNSFVQRQARHLAARALAESGGDSGGAIDRLYWHAFGRGAGGMEVERARELAAEHGLKEVAWVLLNATEFLYVR